MSELVLSAVCAPIATLTLNRPARHNSLVPELLRDLLAALEALRTRPDLRALVLCANGRSFSTGGDVQAFYDHRDDLSVYAHEIVGLLNRVILSMVAFPVPIVAAVHGLVTGGSLGFVLASDLVLVTQDASFTPYYAVVGFSPDGGWTAMLPWVIGRQRAAEALLLNRTITAQEAVDWGMASRLVPSAGETRSIREEAYTAAEMIAGMNPGSVIRTKSLLWGDPAALAARLKAERQRFVEQIVTPEALFGMEKFLRR
ncbi:MAG: enoyl-CoA hydratase/isomerase family protein [Anaerolineae bacterium]